MLSSLSKSFYSAQNRLLQAYNTDPHKYDKKGLGKYVGLLLFISYFTLLPKFFEAILPYLIEYLPNKLITGIGVMSINVFILITYNTVMIFIYKAKHPFFQKYRVNQQKPWPWQENYEQWIVFLKKSLKAIALNVVIGGLMGLMDSWLTDYKWSMQEIPDTKTIVWQFFLFLLLEDLFFYLGHSTLHKSQFYWIHKQHHEFGNTVTIAAEYAHPIQHIFGNSLPSFIGYKMLCNIYPVHCITIWVFLTFRLIETCDGHSGYQWGWAQSDLLPFSAGSSYHNFHHSYNVGNYGSFFKFWDSLFGTNTEYVKYKLKLQNGTKQTNLNNPQSKKVDQTKKD